ncbi:hypothetical protein ACSNOH_05045 [Streptomyces sp. URMC 127]|uniref:hypothetical protein n=1 Tax=Streptomyces sp. URMC 127 TaxID=3423402 RepID=UPI003F1B10E2
MPQILPLTSHLVITDQPSRSWLLPTLVATLSAGAGSQLTVDAGIRVVVVVVILFVIVSGPLLRAVTTK